MSSIDFMVLYFFYPLFSSLISCMCLRNGIQTSGVFSTVECLIFEQISFDEQDTQYRTNVTVPCVTPEVTSDLSFLKLTLCRVRTKDNKG